MSTDNTEGPGRNRSSSGGYVELLAAAIADLSPPERRTEALVEVLKATRSRLRQPAKDSSQVEDVLALELAHDRVLVVLCQQLGVDADLKLFAVPKTARIQLHELLLAAWPEGVSFLTS